MGAWTDSTTNETTTWTEVPMFPITSNDPDALERAADYLLAANGSMFLVDGEDAMNQGDTILVDPNQLTLLADEMEGER